MKINNLMIEDFRGFKHFKMKNLGKINLIVGTNNCGKTTVLEAVGILMSTEDLTSIWTILSGRGEELWADRDSGMQRSRRQVEIRRLFRGHEIKIGTLFQLSAETDLGFRSLVASIVSA